MRKKYEILQMEIVVLPSNDMVRTSGEIYVDGNDNVVDFPSTWNLEIRGGND